MIFCQLAQANSLRIEDFKYVSEQEKSDMKEHMERTGRAIEQLIGSARKVYTRVSGVS